MKLFEVNINECVSNFLTSSIAELGTFVAANKVLAEKSGIQEFFSNEAEFFELKEALQGIGFSSERNHTEYGDYQTNIELAENVVSKLSTKGIKPDTILEPSFGEGNFILAAIKGFDSVKFIYGVEIYKPYVWQAKFSVLELFIQRPRVPTAKIFLSHENVFDYDFQHLKKEIKDQNLLILGNPPWVTNSKLGALDSSNLPVKSNFKKLNGFDAITGKGNFDIAEYITLMMFDTFKHHTGYLAFLVKNSVVKNIIHDQQNRKYPINKFKTYSIDTKKEFNASVESCLFLCSLNSSPGYDCEEYDFYSEKKPKNIFGWHHNKFVADLSHYIETENFDGISPFEWRQGIKHDCSSIMELEPHGDAWINGNLQTLRVEDNLVYSFLKSSDLKNGVVSTSRKYTIVTQKKVGQDTSYIEAKYPKTFQYLDANREAFERRKSSIYKGKPSFSIFGIGDYSFKSYKVAISGLYKDSKFTLVLPQNGKPTMLDDTCYFLSFDILEFAAYTHVILNHQKTQTFLKAITFLDAKRAFTKASLMRLDLAKIALSIDLTEIEAELQKISFKTGISLTMKYWKDYCSSLQGLPLLAFA